MFAAIKKPLALFIAFIFLSAGLHTDIPAQTTLKDAYKKYFLIGAALNSAQFTEADKRGAGIVKKQFNTITPENVLKWGQVHPELNRYNFDASDKYVEFGTKNKMFIIGHCLIWHNQTPDWVFKDDKGSAVTREVLLQRMRDHIHTVVGRYKGRIKGWDVVNEALNEDGTMRQTGWYKIIGEDYLAKAFQFAHEADPKAELYYNDYSLENESKRGGAVALVKKLLAQNIPVKAIGLQGHDRMAWPTVEQQGATIAAFAALGIKVNITELDIEMLPRDTSDQTADVTLNIEFNEKLNPYVKGLPKILQKEQAKRYADLFAVFLKYRKVIDRVTFWGVTDADSWLNGWPIRGRTNYPLLFDREGRPKPAFDAVIKAARRAN